MISNTSPDITFLYVLTNFRNNQLKNGIFFRTEVYDNNDEYFNAFFKFLVRIREEFRRACPRLLRQACCLLIREYQCLVQVILLS